MKSTWTLNDEIAWLLGMAGGSVAVVACGLGWLPVLIIWAVHLTLLHLRRA